MYKRLISITAVITGLFALVAPSALGLPVGTRRAAAQPSPDPALLHSWSNADWQGSLARLQLAAGPGLQVHAWGGDFCAPSPCDWGTVAGHVYGAGPSTSTGTTFTAHFDLSSVQVDLVGVLEGSTLTVQQFYAYPDSRFDTYAKEGLRRAFNDVRWSTRAKITSAHIEAAGAVAGSKLYVISGSPGDCTDGEIAPPVTSTAVYNTATNSWSAGPPVGVARTNDPVAALAGGKIYLIGGATTCGGDTAATVEALDLGTNTWSPLPSSSDLPVTLDGRYHCGAALGTKIYYFEAAGIGVLDTTTGSWTVLPADPLLTPSLFCEAVVTNSGQILITGPGDGSSSPITQRELLFDPATGTITEPGVVGISLAEHAFGFIGVQAIVAGGDFGIPIEQAVQVLGAGGWAADATPLPQTRDDAVSGVIKGKLYIAGGVGGGNHVPPVLVGSPQY
jgi:hypothetical protein